MSRHRILLIEDSVADIAILRYSLDQLGEAYDLHVLHDGEEALAFISRHRHGLVPSDPCVIVLDLHLPKVDGTEVLRELNREPSLSHIRVIVASGGISPRKLDEVLSFGASYVAKPLSVPGYRQLAEEILAACKQIVVAKN